MRHLTPSLLLLAVLLFGCSGPGRPPTGGDTPVTAARLSGTQLVDIHRKTSWEFDANRVVIDNDGQPIPADLLTSVLGEQSPADCLQVDAAWILDEARGELVLHDFVVDGRQFAGDTIVPIRPAGHVRVNLGDHQYNLFRTAKRAADSGSPGD